MHQYYLFEFSFGREIYRTDIFTFLERVVNYSQVVQNIILAEMNKSVIDKEIFHNMLIYFRISSFHHSYFLYSHSILVL